MAGSEYHAIRCAPNELVLSGTNQTFRVATRSHADVKARQAEVTPHHHIP
jgi:hypothetical protein